MGKNLRKILLGGAGLLSFMGYQVYQNNSIKLDLKELRYKDLPEELEDFKICHISDLKGAVYGKNNDRVARMIDALNADIICITGDMVHTDLDDGQAFLDLVGGLDINKVKLFSPGNHETTNKSIGHVEKLNREVLYRKLENLNLHILRGDTYEIEGLPISFTGISDEYDIYEGINFDERYFAPSDHLPMPDRSKLNVALVHRPNYFRSISNYGYDLMLSGHGKAAISKIIPSFFSKEKSSKSEYTKGLFKRKGSFLNVSAGLGLARPIPKVGARPEITLLVLRKGDPDLMNIKEIED